MGLVRRMRPRSVYVVHGDRGSRKALAERLVREGAIDVVLPEDGDVREHEDRPLRRSGGQSIVGLGGGRPLTAEGLGELRDLLLRVHGERRRLLTAEDVAVSWFGGDVGTDEVAAARELLEGVQSAFEPDRRRPYRYRPVPADGSPRRPRAGGGRARATRDPRAGGARRSLPRVRPRRRAPGRAALRVPGRRRAASRGGHRARRGRHGVERGDPPASQPGRARGACAARRAGGRAAGGVVDPLRRQDRAARGRP